MGKDKTVLLSTHILAEVEAVCDRVVIIDRGTIVADDVPEKLIEKKGEVTYTLRVEDGEGVGGLKGALKEVPGVDSIQVDKDKEDTILRLTGRPGRAPVEQKISRDLCFKGSDPQVVAPQGFFAGRRLSRDDRRRQGGDRGQSILNPPLPWRTTKTRDSLEY